MKTTLEILVLSFFLVTGSITTSCRTNRDGAVEGSIIPPGSPARIAVSSDGKEILSVSAGTQDGKFKVALAAGTYTISVTTPGSPSPLRFSDIAVKAGEITTLPPIQLAPSTGTAVLSGKVTPPRPGAEIKLIYEGRERAAVHPDSEGNYEFKELPAGSYVVQATAPGHADDSSPIVIIDNQKAKQDALLFPIASVSGVDWTSGRIRAIGIGLPPQNNPNKTATRELAKRAALIDAERNLLRTVEQIRIDAGRDIRTAMKDPNVATKIRGFLKGYTLVSERELEGGKIEVILELPLSGPSGLSHTLIE